MMKQILTILLIILPLGSLANAEQSFRIQSILSGDTLLLTDGREVHLAGLAAPAVGLSGAGESQMAKYQLSSEELTELGKRSKDFLMRLLPQGQEVRLVLEDDLESGEVNAYVYTTLECDGTNFASIILHGNRTIHDKSHTKKILVNGEVLKQGFAWPSERKLRMGFEEMFAGLYREASSQARGLWSGHPAKFVKFAEEPIPVIEPRQDELFIEDSVADKSLLDEKLSVLRAERDGLSRELDLKVEIIHDMKGQIVSLEESVNKLTDDIRNSQKARENLEQALTEIRNNDESAAVIERLSKEISSKDRQIDALRNELVSRESERNRFSQELKEKSAVIQTMEEELASLNKSIGVLRTDAAESARERDELRSRIGELTKNKDMPQRLEALSAENRKLQNELAEAKGQIDAKDREIKESKANFQFLEKQLAGLKEESRQKDSRLAKLEDDKAGLRNDLQKVLNDGEVLKEKYESLTVRFQSRDDQKTWDRERDKLVGEKNDLNRRLDELRVTQMNSEKEYRLRIETLQNELARIKSEYAQIQKKSELEQATISQYQEQLKQARVSSEEVEAAIAKRYRDEWADQFSRMQGELDAAQENVRRHQAEIHQLTLTIASLRQDNARLEERLAARDQSMNDASEKTIAELERENHELRFQLSKIKEEHAFQLERARLDAEQAVEKVRGRVAVLEGEVKTKEAEMALLKNKFETKAARLALAKELEFVGVEPVSAVAPMSSKAEPVMASVEIEETYYDTGALMMKAEYVNKRKHGRYTKFYESGAVFEESLYVNGRLHGEQKFYFENGSLLTINRYRDGHLHGVKEMYSEDGQIVAKGIYDNDMLVSQTWF